MNLRFISFILIFLMAVEIHASDSVVLLHGLARTSKSMDRVGHHLTEQGFQVVNIGYPSTKYPVEVLAQMVADRIAQIDAGNGKIHFVTHSMGGIILRYMQKHFPVENIGRVVMLSPPNQGSEVVDKLSWFFLFNWINGPAGQQLGTEEDGLIAQLGPVSFEAAIITGDRSINPILSCLIPGPDDGKVSVESAKVSGMTHFKVVHANHTFIMRNKSVIHDVIHYLQTGQLQ